MYRTADLQYSIYSANVLQTNWRSQALESHLNNTHGIQTDRLEVIGSPFYI